MAYKIFLFPFPDVDTNEPDEKSLITYISSMYETFPEPPQQHPLYDSVRNYCSLPSCYSFVFFILLLFVSHSPLQGYLFLSHFIYTFFIYTLFYCSIHLTSTMQH